MRIGIAGSRSKLIALLLWWRRSASQRRCALHAEAVLHERDAESGPGAIFCSVGGMEEIGEEEADDLERHADHCVPYKGEDGADWQAVDVDFIAYHARSQDGCFPVRRGSIGSGRFVRLDAMC